MSANAGDAATGHRVRLATVAGRMVSAHVSMPADGSPGDGAVASV